MKHALSDTNLKRSLESVTGAGDLILANSRTTKRGSMRSSTPIIARRCSNGRQTRLYLNFALLFIVSGFVFLFYSSMSKVTVVHEAEVNAIAIETSIGMTARTRSRHVMLPPPADVGKKTKPGKRYRLPPIGKRYAYEQEVVLSLALPKAIIAKPMNVAIGCAITSRGVQTDDDVSTGATVDWSTAVRKLPIFHELLPSFCRTASMGYRYRFYLAHDYDDPWLSVKEARRAFADAFYEMADDLCDVDNDQIIVDLKFTSCNHSGSPAWAQNDAMMEAYNDDVSMTYFYRVNDDTVLVTPGWTEAYIQILNQFNPPNVGVVGPNFKTNGTSNPNILTYDFVHRTHLDIFKFYYPRELKDWFADDWITHVHQPRTVRVRDIEVMHTKVLKTRYKTSPSNVELLDSLIQKGRDKIQKHIDIKPTPKKRKSSILRHGV